MKPNTDAASGEKTIEERAILEQVLTIFAERESLIVETAELRAEVERLRGTLETIRNMEVYLGGGHRSFDWQYYKEKFSDAIKRAAKALEGAKENNE